MMAYVVVAGTNDGGAALVRHGEISSMARMQKKQGQSGRAPWHDAFIGPVPIGCESVCAPSSLLLLFQSFHGQSLWHT